jgi:hypothetical protein
MRAVQVCLVAGLMGVAGAAHAGTQYTVYCANEKIEVDMRDKEQMSLARGSNLCAFGSFDFLSDAQNFSQQFGGEGGKCNCGR